MQQPLQITLRDIEPSAPLETCIRTLAARLTRFDHLITSCHVTVQLPHRHHHQGQRFDVRMRIAGPQGELMITRQGAHDPAYENAYTAIRSAFETATRRLEARARRLETNARQPQES